MPQYSHYIDSRYPAKSFNPESKEVLQPWSSAITYGSILFNDYKREELATQIMDIKLKAEGLAKERDFYYKQLRDIESVLRDLEDRINDVTVKRFLAIVYETQDIVKVKKKQGRDKERRGKEEGRNEELEDYPLLDYYASLAASSRT